jgi:hypothetical protein
MLSLHFGWQGLIIWVRGDSFKVRERTKVMDLKLKGSKLFINHESFGTSRWKNFWKKTQTVTIWEGLSVTLFGILWFLILCQPINSSIPSLSGWEKGRFKSQWLWWEGSSGIKGLVLGMILRGHMTRRHHRNGTVETEKLQQYCYQHSILLTSFPAALPPSWGELLTNPPFSTLR